MYKDDELFQVLLKYDFDLYRNKSDVPSYLEEHFENYIGDIERAASGNNPLLGSDFCSQLHTSIATIKTICNNLVSIGRINRNGQIKEAFEIAYNLFSSMEPYYLSRFSSAQRDGMFYRIRQGDFRIQPGEDGRKKKQSCFTLKIIVEILSALIDLVYRGFPACI